MVIMNRRLKAVWMKNEDNGTATEKIKLYPLNIVPSFIFLFNKNMEKEASYVIEVKKIFIMIMYIIFMLYFNFFL